MNSWIKICMITAPHGVRGWVKVLPLTDDPERFSGLDKVYLFSEPGNEPPASFLIEGVKFQARRVLLKLEGINSREDADSLRNRFLYIPSSEVLPIEEEDTYYYFQLEGIDVFNENNELIGTLESIFRTGSNDVYNIRAKDGKTEFMAPAIKSCIIEVDIEAGRMTVDSKWLT